MSRPTVIYFDIRARAEPIRLILEEIGVAYEDKQLTGPDWPGFRGSTPFNELPLYRDGELEIAQSHAIYRHLARVHDLYGTNETERTRCDVVEEALADLNQWIGSTQRRVDFEAKRDEFVERELSPMLQRLERFLETNPCGPAFWVGSSLTFVDLIALGMLDCTGSMFPRAMEERHVLQQLCDGIAARPRISAYLDSPRRPPGIQYGPTGKRIDARSREGWRT